MKIKKLPKKLISIISLPSSKSISNRALILQQLSPQIILEGLATADDTQLLLNSLNELSQQKALYKFYLDNAGTTFRFLTAYLSNRPGATYLLYGSERMHNRPIKPLVEALRKLGAKINYLKNQGFPPLEITGTKLHSIDYLLEIPSNQSSQFASAIMLIAPSLDRELIINAQNLVSANYLLLTFKLMQKLGFKLKQLANTTFKIYPYIPTQKITYRIPGDWSLAIYWYAIASLSQSATIKISPLKIDDIQPDTQPIIDLYRLLGIETIQSNAEEITITKVPNTKQPNYLFLNLSKTPDLVMPIVINLILLNIQFEIIGIEHLKYKESDRITALQKELKKIGISLVYNNGTLTWTGKLNLKTKPKFKVYNDHRLAMSFSILATQTELEIDNPSSVSKSYPEYWENFAKLYITKNKLQ